MGTQEWILLGLVLVLPLVVAVAVTLWTLEQAIKRNRKNRPDRAARRVSEPVADSVLVSGGFGSPRDADSTHHDIGGPGGADTIPSAPDATPSSTDSSSSGDSGGDGGSSSD